MSSESTLGEVTDYDVVFIGNLAAVAADIMVSNLKEHNYRLCLLHLNATVEQYSLFPLNSTRISIDRVPKGIEIINQRIEKLNPGQRWVLLQGGRWLSYRYLVHGEDGWTRIQPDHPLHQALLHSKYSLIYSNLSGVGPQVWSGRQRGNFVFYVPKGPNSFSQSYPFLYFYNLLSEQQRKNRQFVILLEGDSFFPHCVALHSFLEQQLKDNHFKLVYGVELQRVDYLRRVFYFRWHEREQSIRYDTAYCLVGEQTPALLADSGINPYNSHLRMLHNSDYDTVYVLGADLLPTTHSFSAVNTQMHLIIKNLAIRLGCGRESKISLLPYEGQTQFNILLSNRQKIPVTHSYYEQDYELGKERGWWGVLYQQYIECWLTRQFYNFKTFGLPYYLFSPSQKAEQREQITNTEFNVPSLK